jgi:hypothetical protein
LADRLYLSLWIHGFNETNMLRHFGKMLELFPYSKLSKRGPVLRVYAIEHAEPPLFEREFAPGTEPRPILDAAREFMHEDCACQVDTFWDLWQHKDGWKLEPTAVILSCLGSAFDNENADHLRIEFGLDAHFLPQPGVEGSLRMVQSNVRSMLHLVNDVDRVFDLERRQLWSESGVNFAEILTHALGNFHVN